MRNLAENLWTTDGEMRLLGTTLGLRSTIVRLRDESLWVHSPVPLNEHLIREVKGLGEVSALVAPNNVHYLSLPQWRAAFPEAAVYVAPGVAGKLRLASPYLVLDSEFVNPWTEALDWCYLPGIRFFDESVFLHRASRSLIVTDLLQNHTRTNPALIESLLLRPMGFKDVCIAPPLKLSLMFQDRPAFQAALARVAEWEFDRVVVTHGDILETGAREQFDQLTARFRQG